jgi:protein BCP1
VCARSLRLLRAGPKLIPSGDVAQANPHVAPLLAYLRARSAASPELSALLSALSPAGTPNGPQVGLVISERLINMPVQTQPPLWRMLGDELSVALGAGKPYGFTHLLLLSKLYLPPNFPKSSAGKKAGKAGKKVKAQEAAEAMDVDSADLRDGLLPFHPEDSLLARVRRPLSSRLIVPPRTFF